MMLRPGDHCVSALQLKCSGTASPPWGALQLQAAALRQGPFGHTAPQEAHSTYHSVPRVLSASQALLSCCTAGKHEAGPCTWGTHQLKPRQLCRAAMGKSSKGGVKSYSNSLCCHSSSLPPNYLFYLPQRPWSKKNRQRQDASHRIKWNWHSSLHVIQKNRKPTWNTSTTQKVTIITC